MSAPSPAKRAAWTQLLGGMEPERFLAEHWQKKPLLVRQAIPRFAGIVDKEQLLKTAARDDAVSRLVVDRSDRRQKNRFELFEGPLHDVDPKRLPKDGWTFLVQGVEGLLPGAWEILQRFDFLPAARIDDLMISWAAPGGSVGPHEDRYDVFLLQGPGRRRWQIQTGGERRTDKGSPVRVLTSFQPTEEWVLEPGDMLYLPPGVAHHGIALDACFTYSIGLLAPSHEAIVQNFVAYLGQRAAPKVSRRAMYADPDLRVVDDPVQIPDAMLARVSGLFDLVRFDERAIEEFLGRLLTGPKPHVVFAAGPAADTARTAKRLASFGTLALALPSRGLVRGNRAFLNGDVVELTAGGMELARELFSARTLKLPRAVDDATAGVLGAWWSKGFVGFDSPG